MLDDFDKIQALDKTNLLSNISDFADQILAAWDMGEKFAIPAHYYNAKNIVLSGMGGSGIAGLLAKNLAWQTTRMPIEVVNGYEMPTFCDNHTLLIAVSYSGNTEETIATVRQAVTRQSKVIVIATGGDIAALAKKERLPYIEFNYGSPPRAAWGYPFGLIVQIFKRLNLIEIDEKKIKYAAKYLKNLSTKINPTMEAGQNIAKSYAEQLVGKIPIIVGAEHLAPIAYRWSTQFNENANQLSWHEVLPEMNHNRVAGMLFPKQLKDQFVYYILSSKNTHERNQLRETILAKVLEKNGFNYETVYLQPTTDRFTEALSFALLGDYISYYLAILNGIDPTTIANIDFLKSELEKNME